jgi:cytochrome P450
MSSSTAPVSQSEMTYVRTHRDCQEVLRSDAFLPSLHYRSSAPLLADVLLTLEGDEHLRRRRNEIVMFSRASLMEYELGIIVPALQASLGITSDGLSGQVKVDLLHVMRDALLRVSARIIGLDGVDSAAGTEQLREIAERFGEGASAEWSLEDKDAIVARALAAKSEFITSLVAPSRARRVALLAANARGEIADDELPSDLLTILLRSYPEWDDDKLVREAIFFLVASSSTTTHSAPHVLREIMDWFSAHPEDRAKAQDLSFLQRAVSEALRLHPPVPALLRSTLRDHTLASGMTFSAGEQVAVDLNASNRDESVFGEDAKAFNPYRVTPRIQNFAESFGNGAHMCPGRMVAVGAGNGSIDRDDVPAGVLVRLLQHLFSRPVTFDPNDIPHIRSDTSANRYASFPVLIDFGTSL